MAKAQSLPRWDLSDLYPGIDSPALQHDIDDAKARALAFREQYKGKLEQLDGPALGAVIAEYEAIDEQVSRVMSFAYLAYCTDMENPEMGRFFQSMQEAATEISTPLIFFGLEINQIEGEDLKPRMSAPKLNKYASWLRDTRQFRDHLLSDEMESLLHERSIVGATAWNRLFNETCAGLRFALEGKEATMAEVLDRMSHPERAKRKEACETLGNVLKDNIRTFSLITNTLAKDKQIDDKWRKYPHPTAHRNLANAVEDDVVEALVTVVKEAHPRLSHRYYALKAKWMGTPDHLDYWDRNAPLPDEDNRTIEWPEAQEIVLDAYGQFSPELADLGRNFFDKPWIDVPPMPGKDSGAFAHPTVPSAHPYLMLNYYGKTRDVMTLAHELGHGVHQLLAGRAQGHFGSDTPLTLAETASVFGEMLTFQSMLKSAPTPAARRTMLASKVEDMLNTVVRQIAFYEFELKVHTARQKSELTPDDLAAHWMAVQTDSLGPMLRFDENYKHFWAYIPHFIHSPFYVYAYAFGDCLVNALYAVYQDAEAGFADKYLDMLKAGGTKRHKELLAPFGLDASDPAFWHKGLSVVESLIDQLCELDETA